MVSAIMNNKIRDAIKAAGMQQNEVAKLIGINEIHFSRVINKKVSLTPQMAEKLSNIKELQLEKKELLFPSLDLEIAGQFWSGTKVEMFKFDRPILKIPSAIMPGSYGINFRANKDVDTNYSLDFNQGIIYIFNSYWQKNNKIDPLCFKSVAMVERDNGDLAIGWISEPDAKNRFYFTVLHSTITMLIKIKWAAICSGTVNLKALPDIHENESMHIE